MRHARRAFAALFLFALPSRADDAPACGATSRSWIRVSSDAPGFVASFRAEVATKGFDACASGGPRPPVATVTIAATQGSATVDVLDVLDVVTSKRVSRSVDLASIPADGRDLALAVAADELLRASWAELALTTAPPPRRRCPRRCTTSSTRRSDRRERLSRLRRAPGRSG